MYDPGFIIKFKGSQIIFLPLPSGTRQQKNFLLGDNYQRVKISVSTGHYVKILIKKLKQVTIFVKYICHFDYLLYI
jgi:hypothetical protein